MEIPSNLVAPRMKLAADEQVIRTHAGLRRKGLFGNRFGELYLTNQRVAFVKAIAGHGVVSAALDGGGLPPTGSADAWRRGSIDARGVHPMLEFERGAVTADKVKVGKQTLLVLTAAYHTERIAMDPGAIDALLPLIEASDRRRRAAGPVAR